MPNSLFPSSKHCSIGHLNPLSQTNKSSLELIGALLKKNEYEGLGPMVRFIINQTSLVGNPFLAMTTRRLENSYSIGPLVPSDTLRRYQKKSLLPTAKSTREIDFFSPGLRTCFFRISPLCLYFFSIVAGIRNQHLVLLETPKK